MRQAPDALPAQEREPGERGRERAPGLVLDEGGGWRVPTPAEALRALRGDRSLLGGPNPDNAPAVALLREEHGPSPSSREAHQAWLSLPECPKPYNPSVWCEAGRFLMYEPGGTRARRPDDVAAYAMEFCGSSAAAETPRAALRRVLALPGPRPLVAQEPPDEVCAPRGDDQPTHHPGCHVGLPPLTAPGRCLSGFDRNEHTGQCEAPPPPPPPTPTSGSGGGTPPPPPPPEPEPACTDDQIAIAAEYNDPVAWPCTTFTHSVKTGRGTHGHTTGYLTDSYSSGSGNVLSGVAAAGVSGAIITSDWRCPTGNSIVGGTGLTHVHGRAGDFWAPGFLDEADGANATPEEERVARELHDKFAASAQAAGATWSSPFGYNGTHKDHIHIYW